MNTLVNLVSIVSANAKDLRNLHDKVEANIRALESARVSSPTDRFVSFWESYGM